MNKKRTKAVAFVGGVSLAALTGGCQSMPGTVAQYRQAPPGYSYQAPYYMDAPPSYAAREPAAPSFGSSALYYYYARPSLPIEPRAASAEREGYGLPDAGEVPKAATAPRRAKQAAIPETPPPPAKPAAPRDPDCVGWWRICHFL